MLETALITDWFHKILDNAPDAIMALKAVRDQDGKITDLQFLFTNKKALQSVHHTDITGKLFTREFPEAVKIGLFDQYVKVIETGNPWSDEVHYYLDGFEFWAHVNAKKIGDACLVSFLDITSSKKVQAEQQKIRNAEEEILMLNKALMAKNQELRFLNSELKTFATIAANDYSETLRHLYINLELIVSNDAHNLSNSGRANLRRAQSAIQRMKLLTDDLKAYSKLQEMDSMKQDVDLNAILNSVLSDFVAQTSQYNITVNCVDMPAINGYPFLISLVFHHLLDNAIKFRNDDNGHTIFITCRESVPGSSLPYEQAQSNLNYHTITVSDSGQGFPAEEKEKIFGIFYRLHDKSKYKGSGIGLAICKKIMDMHGGFIVAESEAGKGAVFHCFFPA